MMNLPLLLRKIAKRRLLVIGDVMLDHYFWGDATRISPEAPVPVVNVFKATDTVGGAANVANNIAALGAAAELVGAIGRDYNGDKLRTNLRERRIEFDDRFLLSEAKTITKTRVIVRNQQLCRLDHEDGPAVYRRVLETADRWRLLEEKIARADGIILSDYAKGVLTTAVISRLAKLARRHRKFIALDPKPSSGNQFQGLDLITPNRREALELAELRSGADAETDFTKVCSIIWARYSPNNLVITLGPDGMLTSIRGRVIRTIPTAARQVYDVSGAGDTVIAVASLVYAATKDIRLMAEIANIAGGLVCEEIGRAHV